MAIGLAPHDAEFQRTSDPLCVPAHLFTTCLLTQGAALITRRQPEGRGPLAVAD
jgi:hypothetical protein